MRTLQARVPIALIDLFMARDFEGAITAGHPRAYDRTALIGHADEMLDCLRKLGVTNLPTPADVADEFLEIIGELVNVAHATSFDRKDRS